MRIKREYVPKEVNWRLFPDLLEKVVSSIPESERMEVHYKLHPEPRFEVSTFSQSVALESEDDFLSFIKKSTEQPSSVNIRIACIRTASRMDPYEIELPFFSFSWSQERIHASVARNTTSNALQILEDLQEILQLEPTSPPMPEEENIESRPLRRTVFIAYSFDDVGRSYAFQLTNFFSLIGFEVATGEGYSPERVSNKIRRRLMAQEIVVAIMSQHNDMTWLIQEITGAEFIGKPLILLAEEGVEFKSGILGDLEYIRFPEGHVSQSITPILEGLRELGFSFA